MDPGGLIQTVGGGVAGLVLGAIGAIGDGVTTMVTAGERALPGPLFPLVVGWVLLGFVWWLLKK